MNAFDTMLASLQAQRPATVIAARLCAGGDGSRTDMLLDLLDRNACLSTVQLAKASGLTSRQVWGLLKARLQRGAVLFKDGLWSLNLDYSDPVRAAVQLLRERGWTVEPPEGHCHG